MIGVGGRRFVGALLAGAFLHLVVAMAIAVVARGWDLDQLRGRSPASRLASAIEPALWLVHDAMLRAVPTGRIAAYRWMIPLALATNAVAYGVALALALRWWRRRRRGAPPAA